MEPARIFRDEFVPNVESAPYHSKWVAANKNGDAPKWAAFRSALYGYKKGDTLTPPSMATKYGRSLVASGKLHMSVVDLGAVWESPPDPDPDPPPPPPPPSRTFQRKSDMEAGYNLWSPTGWYSPATVSGTPWPAPGGFFEISTPHGNGLRYVATSAMLAPWDSGSKICQAGHFDETWTANWEGQRQLWSGYIRFPSSLNLSGFNTGWFNGSVLMEWGTIYGSGSTTVGHELLISNSGRMQFAIRDGTGSQPTRFFPMSSPVPMDTWFPWSWELKWSQGSDGYMLGSINGTQIMNIQGPTMWNNERVRHFGIGFYSNNVNGITNGVEHGGMQMAIL